MNDMMKKLLQKKSKERGPMSDGQQEAKMDVLKSLKGKSSGSMMDRLKGMKKVSVLSDSEEGLEEGLDKAKDVVKSLPMELGSPEEEMEKMAGHEAQEEDQFADCSEEEVDELLQKLLAKKEELQASKERA